MNIFNLLSVSALLLAGPAICLPAYAGKADNNKVISKTGTKKKAVISGNTGKSRNSHQCCGPNGCYPAPAGHPWNCGNAPIVLRCDNNGICSPQ